MTPGSESLPHHPDSVRQTQGGDGVAVTVAVAATPTTSGRSSQLRVPTNPATLNSLLRFETPKQQQRAAELLKNLETPQQKEPADD